MLDPNSIVPEREQRSGLISGYQELGESALLSVDALYTDRDSLTTSNQPTQMLFGEPQTRIFAVSPNLEFYLQIGRAHVWTPVTNAHLVCRLLLEKKKKQLNTPSHITTTTL